MRQLFPIARASREVVVQPGREVPVFYRTPAVIVTSGSTGHLRQAPRGLLLTVLLPLTVAVVADPRTLARPGVPGCLGSSHA